MSRIGKVVGTVVMAGAAALLGLGALVFVQPAAADTVAVQAVTALEAHGGRGGFCGAAGLQAAADALGITTDELQTQLRAGESLSDQAETAGVDVADVLAAVDAACVQAQRDAIEQAVTDGTLTREKADWLLEGLDQGFWGTPASGGIGLGFGPGGDFGGHRGPGGRGGFGPGTDQTAPTATPVAGA
jgi:hypothetical protein